MNKVKKFLIFALISVLFQTLLLVFINCIYLPGRKNNVQIVKLYEIDQNNKISEAMIPEGSEQIKISYDGSFAAYMHGGQIVAAKLSDGAMMNIAPAEGFRLGFYRWLPDRNIIIYSMSSNAGREPRIRIETYDANSGVKRAYPDIAGIPVNSEIIGIELSTITNVVYLKVQTGANKVQVYKFNILDELSYVMAISSNVVVREANLIDMLVCQDEMGKIFVRSGENHEETYLDFNNRMALLGLDGEDNVYTGELTEQNTVSKVYYGKLNKIADPKWKHILLKSPVLPEQIIVTHESSVYVLDGNARTLTDICSGSRFSYNGVFIGVAGNNIFSLDDNNIIRVTPMQDTIISDD